MEERGRIGIPRALMFYRYFPFWHTCFRALNWEVVVSEGVRKKERIVYFEDSCLPMKLLVTHTLQLKDRVDYLFIPRLISIDRTYILCPKFRGAPDVARLAIGETVPLLDETIDLRMRGGSLLRSFLKIGKKLGSSQKESKEAFLEAQQCFLTFQREVGVRINRLPSKQLFEMEISTPSPPKISLPLGSESLTLQTCPPHNSFGRRGFGDGAEKNENGREHAMGG